MRYFRDETDGFYVLSPGVRVGSGWREITEAEGLALIEQAKSAWSPDPLLKVARAGREIALNRLAGIAFAAQHSGDSATVDACLVARQALLDITKLPAVKAATDDASLTAAIGSAYSAIIAASPPIVISAFADIQS